MSLSLFQGIVFLISSLLFSSVLGWVVRFAYERLALFSCYGLSWVLFFLVRALDDVGCWGLEGWFLERRV